MTILEWSFYESEMPQSELRRDKGLTQRGHQSYSFMLVFSSPIQAEDTFSDMMLLNLQWETQLHKSGEKVLLPVLPGPFGDLTFKMLDRLDKSNTAKHGLGFTAGSGQLRWFYADELWEKTLLNEPISKHTMALFRDLYECSEHFYTTWCKEHPGKKLEMDFDYLGKRAAAVESCRTKLRGCIMIAEIAITLRKEAEAEAAETTEPPANVARVEPVVRPPGMPPMMPTYTPASSSGGPWTPEGESMTAPHPPTVETPANLNIHGVPIAATTQTGVVGLQILPPPPP